MKPVTNMSEDAYENICYEVDQCNLLPFAKAKVRAILKHYRDITVKPQASELPSDAEKSSDEQFAVDISKAMDKYKQLKHM